MLSEPLEKIAANRVGQPDRKICTGGENVQQVGISGLPRSIKSWPAVDSNYQKVHLASAIAIVLTIIAIVKLLPIFSASGVDAEQRS